MRAHWATVLLFGILAIACGRSGVGARRSEAGVSADGIMHESSPADSIAGADSADAGTTAGDAAIPDAGAGERPGLDGALIVAPWELTCGNGYHDPGESCDDGNRRPGDGCDSNCCVEGNLMCCSNLGCWVTEHQPCHCGDGFLDLREQCDDGNLIFGDGCNGYCEIETGLCGNGIVDPGEECDDGNLEFGSGPYGDGCDPSCRRERIGCFAPDAGM